MTPLLRLVLTVLLIALGVALAIWLLVGVLAPEANAGSHWSLGAL